MEKEEWLNIEGYEGRYKISNRGKVFSNISNKLLTPQKMSSGYLFIKLKDKNLSLHRLVAFHFLTNTKMKPQVAHIDGCKTNNNINNLVWSTQAENELHKVWQGIHPRKLSDRAVLDICERYKKDEPIGCIAKQYGVSSGVVRNILSKKYYKDVEREKTIVTRKDIITSCEIKHILKLRSNGHSYGKIAKITNRGKTSVARIIKRHT